MAELIQFNCPVCGILLQLPLAMAAQQGPCPHCEREIIAPDPQWGLGAQEVAIAVPMPEPEPFQPFLESSLPPSLAPRKMSVEAVPEPPPTVKLGPAVAEHRAKITALQPPAPTRSQGPWVVILSSLLTGSVALVWGYALGVRSQPNSPGVPPPTMTGSAVEIASPVVTTPPPLVEPVPILPAPAPGPAPVPPPVTEPSPKVAEKPEAKPSVSTAAEASLRAFLDAPDWAARCAHVLQSGKMREAMEAYSHEVPDGPTHYQSISVKQSHIDEKTGFTLYVFYVKTADFPEGIPVAVQETAVGWLVDWQTFVEFRDGLFQKFVDGPADRNGRFHLSVTAPPADRAAATENEHFTSYLLQSPLAKTAQLAFVRKGTDIAATFETAVSSGAPFTPVLEVARHKTSEGQGYLEVVKIVATDWLPAGN